MFVTWNLRLNCYSVRHNLLKAFIITKEKGLAQCFELPRTFHNLTFKETITRSLFLANRLNGLFFPLIANMYFLLIPF